MYGSGIVCEIQNYCKPVITHYYAYRSYIFQSTSNVFLYFLVQSLNILAIIWYLFNQTYGLPEDMDAYAELLLSGLHRPSEPDSEDQQVLYARTDINYFTREKYLLS